MTQPVTPQFATDRKRPEFPQRSVITAGMPYGNKDLHFGHVGGVFIHADAMARFLRDRIGAENVMFVSGTDCYGSAIVADFEKRNPDRQALPEGSPEFEAGLMEFVTANHQRQRATLDRYSVAPDLFAASALEPYRTIHERLGAEILETLYRHGHLEKRVTPQFYDAARGIFLNGRQVTGRCPIQGCKSDKAYADECSLGHQYQPSELIAPRSTLTGEEPEMRDVANWYLVVEKFGEALRPWYDGLLESGEWREYSVRDVLRYFEPPTIHMKRDEMDEQAELLASLPPHRREPGRGDSDRLVFDSIADLDAARDILSKARCRTRSGTTLVPFRLTGNLKWGLPAPVLEELEELTFWVWPESLWAPISFTAARLAELGRPDGDWKRWWSSDDARVYQFIGEDNLYFYGLAEMAMFLGMQGEQFQVDTPEGQLHLPRIIANRHLLFLDKKASSSGNVKPPMAADLLEYYTSDQLRIHFLSLGLGLRNISFRPRPLDPQAKEGASDPVLKDGNVLSNALNKSVRSCFYTSQKYFDRRLPEGEVSDEVRAFCEHAIIDFEEAMSRQEFHVAVEAGAKVIREMNRQWAQAKPFNEDCDPELRRQSVLDAFHMVRVAVTLMHPVAPDGTEKVREYLGVGEELWDWGRIFDTLADLLPDLASHRFAELPPKTDFFDKPECQYQ